MFRNHPRGLAPLFFTEMWERFSFYIMLALLTLYMTADPSEGGLGFSKEFAAHIYGLYVGLIYFTPFCGGIIADKAWGYGKTIIAGGFAMMAGHLSLAGDSLAFFFAGLVLLIIGNGLFKPNISTLLGNLYKDRFDLKDQGYNIFYMGINIGALIAPLLGTYLNLTFGWHVAFGCASVGMLLSIVIFMVFRGSIAAGEIRPSRASAPVDPSLAVDLSPEAPPHVQRMRTQALWIIFGVVMFFWMAFKQNGSTLIHWSKEHTEALGSLDFSKAASVTKAINPFFVITLTPFLVMFWTWLRRNEREVSTPKKMLLGMILTAISCAVMALAGLLGGDTGRVTVFWLVGGYFFMTLGELCISPVGLSVVSKLAPQRSGGIWMGGWFVATSFGNYLAGFLGIFWDRMLPSGFFSVLVGTSLAAAGLLLLFLRRLEAAMDSLKPSQPSEPEA